MRARVSRRRSKNSVQLGRKTIHDLLDGVPTEMTEQARATVLAVPGVLGVPRIRMRRTGGEWFSDVVVLEDPGMTVEEAHGVADRVEAGLGALMPSGDVTVHTEPFHGATTPERLSPA